MNEFESACVVRLPLGRVASFFAEPTNLEKLTPGWMRFRVLEAPDELQAGSVLRYRAGPFGLSMTWVARIAVWEPPFLFSDVQLRGPYRLWEHTHSFAEVDGGTEIRDRIRYRLPGGPLAPVADRLGHRAMLSRLFEHRTRRLVELGEDEPPTADARRLDRGRRIARMDTEQQARLEAIIQREAHALVAKSNAIPSIKQLDAAVRAAPDYDPRLDDVPGFTKDRFQLMESELEALS